MAKKIKSYNQLIAVNLIEKLREIEQNPPKITGFSISRLEYLISLIITHKQDNHKGAWTILYTPYLRRIVPKADEYLKFLRDEGIIEWKNYSAGRNSRLYRLKNEGRTEFRRITDMNLINRIEMNRRKMKRLNSKKYPVLNEYILKVNIDECAALKTVEAMYADGIKADQFEAQNRRTFSLSEIDKIRSGSIYIKCNKTNGRLDSNFTRLPSELTKHLSINGSQLYEIDIRNSQPFFAAAMLNPTPEVEKIMIKYLGQKLTMLTKSMYRTDCKDVALYTSLVIGGKFYEPFMKDKLAEDGILFANRKALKKSIFIVFFGKPYAWRYNSVAKTFKALFPNITLIFDAIKKQDYERLAIFLQRLESYTILERVAPRIIERLPGLPFLTKHDSLLPTRFMVPYNVDEVKKILIEVVVEVTGLTPNVEVKFYEESKLRA